MPSSPISAGRRWLLALLLAALACGAGRLLADDADTAYRRGIEAVDRQDWQAVVEAMSAAIAARPEAGGRVKIYGMRFEDYTPHYYLGIAHQQLNDCAAALAAWSSPQVNVALRREQLRQLDEGRRDCVRRTNVNEASPSATDPVAFARAVGEVATVLAAGELSLREIDEKGAGDWGKILQGHDELAARLAARREALSQARRAFESGRDHGELAAVLAAGERAKGVAQALAELRDELAALADEPAAFAPTTVEPTPPQLLQDAAALFLAGRYDRVVARLADLDTEPAKVKSTALLLRAAARFALFHEDGERASELLAEARRDVEACRLLSPALQPSAYWFSPPFRRLFAEAQKR